MDERAGTRPALAERSLRLALWMRPELAVLGYVAAFVLTAVAVQALSSRPPSSEDAPIESFTTGLLFMLSLVAFLRAMSEVGNVKLSALWLASSGALALLAIDEFVAIPERSERVGVNDDWVKVVMWIGAAFYLSIVARLERTSAASRRGMVIGYLFHSLYILVETGDGEFFSLPLPIDVLKWAEEVFELLFLSGYLYAFVLLQLGSAVRPMRGGASP